MGVDHLSISKIRAVTGNDALHHRRQPLMQQLKWRGPRTPSIADQHTAFELDSMEDLQVRGIKLGS